MPTALTTIKNWFKTGLVPTQEQFWATWDSFWHKNESIPKSAIEGLEQSLTNKADQELVELHISDNNAHPEKFLEIASAISNKVDKVPGQRLIPALELTRLGTLNNQTKRVLELPSIPNVSVSGFVTYINSLPQPLVVAANEAFLLKLTDTNRVFELLLRGRSFGVGHLPITAADVLDYTAFLDQGLAQKVIRTLQFDLMSNINLVNNGNWNINNFGNANFWYDCGSNNITTALAVGGNTIQPITICEHPCNITKFTFLDCTAATFGTGIEYGIIARNQNDVSVMQSSIIQTGQISGFTAQSLIHEVNNPFVLDKGWAVYVFFRNSSAGTVVFKRAIVKLELTDVAL